MVQNQAMAAEWDGVPTPRRDDAKSEECVQPPARRRTRLLSPFRHQRGAHRSGRQVRHRCPTRSRCSNGSGGTRDGSAGCLQRFAFRANAAGRSHGAHGRPAARAGRSSTRRFARSAPARSATCGRGTSGTQRAQRTRTARQASRIGNGHRCAADRARVHPAQCRHGHGDACGHQGDQPRGVRGRHRGRAAGNQASTPGHARGTAEQRLLPMFPTTRC